MLRCSASLPSSLLVAGSVVSQPLPSLPPNFSVGIDFDPAFGSAPLPPLEALPQEVRRRLLASSSAGPASRMASVGSGASVRVSLPRVQLTEEEQALLAALEAPNRRRPSWQATVMAAAAGAAPAVDYNCGGAERLSGASHASGGPQLMPQRTLPLPAQQQWPEMPGLAAVTPALAPALSLGHASDSLHMDSSHALEHALNLAAAAAMGGDSLLSRSSGQGSGSRSMSTAASAVLPAVERSSAASAGTPGWPRSAELSLADGIAAAPQRELGGAQAAAGGRAAAAAAAGAAECPLLPGALASRPLEIRARHLPSAADLPSPFGGPMSPFAAMAGFSDSEGEDAAAEGAGGGAAPLPTASAEEQLSDGVGEEDQGVDLPMDLSTLGRARSAVPDEPYAEAEDALIEAALDAELGPAGSAGSGTGGAAAPGPAQRLEQLAAQMARLPPMPARPAAQRQHSLRTLGEFEGVSTMWELSDLVGGGGGGRPARPALQQLVRQRQERTKVALAQPLQPARGAAAPLPPAAPQQGQQQAVQAAPAGPPPPQQATPKQQPAAAVLPAQQATAASPWAQQATAWPLAASPLPSVRGGGADPGAARPSGAAALEALADLQAQQAQQGPPPPAQQQQQLPMLPLPLLGSPAGLLGSPAGPHRLHSGSSGAYSLELGPPHLEVDERTGEVGARCAWLPVARAPLSRPSWEWRAATRGACIPAGGWRRPLGSLHNTAPRCRGLPPSPPPLFKQAHASLHHHPHATPPLPAGLPRAAGAGRIRNELCAGVTAVGEHLGHGAVAAPRGCNGAGGGAAVVGGAGHGRAAAGVAHPAAAGVARKRRRCGGRRVRRAGCQWCCSLRSAAGAGRQGGSPRRERWGSSCGPWHSGAACAAAHPAPGPGLAHPHPKPHVRWASSCT